MQPKELRAALVRTRLTPKEFRQQVEFVYHALVRQVGRRLYANLSTLLNLRKRKIL